MLLPLTPTLAPAPPSWTLLSAHRAVPLATQLLCVFLLGMILTSPLVLLDMKGCSLDERASFATLTMWPVHSFVAGVALGALLIQVGGARGRHAVSGSGREG